MNRGRGPQDCLSMARPLLYDAAPAALPSTEITQT
jgi:hypothetical protein